MNSTIRFSNSLTNKTLVIYKKIDNLNKFIFNKRLNQFSKSLRVRVDIKKGLVFIISLKSDYEMTKKGKFKLLSYLIEDYLIFYKSLTKHTKFYAFSIFKIFNFNKIFSILSEILKKGLLYYFSIQISIATGGFYAILCFKANSKNKIIELFGITYHKLSEKNKSIKFFFKKDLENIFINILFKKKNHSNIRLIKKNDFFLIKNHSFERALNFYEVFFENYGNNHSLSHLKEFMKNINQNGYLIINFQILNAYINLNTYFVQISSNPTADEVCVEKEVNNFFKKTLLKKLEFKLKNIYQILWRKNINSNFFPLYKIERFFSIIDDQNLSFLKNFDLKFQKLLKANNIEFVKLNDDLILIERRILFLIQVKLDFKLIMRIFKRFFSKYLIYLLVLDDKEYEKLIKVKKINQLKEIIILNYKKFLNLKFEEFKN